MGKALRKYGVLIAALVFMLVLIAVQAQAAEYWKSKFVRISATAGETLALGDVVCIKAADSRAWKADADSSTLRPAVGVIGKGGAAGTTVEIVLEGVLAGQTAASAGARLFLSATAGAITTSEPTNSQTIGVVLPGSTAEIAASQSTVYYMRAVIPVSDGAAY